jgi:hypothetical protein
MDLQPWHGERPRVVVGWFADLMLKSNTSTHKFLCNYYYMYITQKCGRDPHNISRCLAGSTPTISTKWIWMMFDVPETFSVNTSTHTTLLHMAIPWLRQPPVSPLMAWVQSPVSAWWANRQWDTFSPRVLRFYRIKYDATGAPGQSTITDDA